jgi:hypothetical protein
MGGAARATLAEISVMVPGAADVGCEQIVAAGNEYASMAMAF